MQADQHNQQINQADGKELKKSLSCTMGISITAWKFHIADEQIKNLYKAEQQINYGEHSGNGYRDNGFADSVVRIFFRYVLFAYGGQERVRHEKHCYDKKADFENFQKRNIETHKLIYHVAEYNVGAA